MQLRAFCTALSVLAGPSFAQDATHGEEDYFHYCAACHGIDATGNGPMASILTLQPVDLTQLANRNDGVFPINKVIARIDGRDPLVAHGSPMPVYGDFFEGKGVTVKDEEGILVMTSQPIADLVMFLARLQE